jgi:hypothetical protein
MERKIIEGIAILRGVEGRLRAEDLHLHAAEAIRMEGLDDVILPAGQ